MTTKTYSLDEACDIIRGGHAPADRAWMSKRLRSGEFPGFKPGRNWRFTEEHLRVILERLEPKRSVLPDVSLSGMTRTSRRRMLNA